MDKNDLLYLRVLYAYLARLLRVAEPPLDQCSLEKGLSSEVRQILATAAHQAGLAQETLFPLLGPFPFDLPKEMDPDQVAILDMMGGLGDMIRQSYILIGLRAGHIFPRRCFGGSLADLQKMALTCPPQPRDQLFVIVEFKPGWKVSPVSGRPEQFVVLAPDGRARVAVTYQYRGTQTPIALYYLLDRFTMGETLSSGEATFWVRDQPNCRVIYQSEPIRLVPEAEGGTAHEESLRARATARDATSEWMRNNLPRPPYYSDECWNAPALPEATPWPD